MKRPKTIWIFSFFMFSAILISLYNNVSKLVTWKRGMEQMGAEMAYFHSMFWSNYASLLLILPTSIFLYKFIMLRKSSLPWMYISFGGYTLILFISGHIVTGLLELGFAIVLYRYIQNKTVDGKPLFS